jgi:hypothetical protein
MSKTAQPSFPLDVEPEPAKEPEWEVEPDATEGVAAPQMALAQVLPPELAAVLPALVAFVPDVRLKHAADTQAARVLAVPVTDPDGLVRLDSELATLRTRLADIDAPFADPVSWANQLHKRLTGLRRDFRAAGEEALESGGRRLYAEQRRREAAAEEQRRKDQAEADRRARADAERAAKEAKKAGAAAPVVDALKQASRTATAPPVQSAAPPPPKNFTPVAKW